MQKVGRIRKGGAFEICDAETPQAGADDVIVEVGSCGICGTDLAMFREDSAPDGAVLGHEFSGTVVSTGTAVTAIETGQRVTVNPMVDYVGLGRVPGAFARYVRVPSPEPGRNIFTLPDTIDDETGALIEPFAVALHAVNRSGARPGERAVIFGAGPIGLCVVAALRARGVEEILAIDPSAKRRALAGTMGASAVHGPQDGSSIAFVAGHFGSLSFPHIPDPVAQADMAFDCAGVEPALRDALHSLSSGGRLVLVADPHDAALPDLRLVMLHELRVMGALAYENEFSEAIDLLGRGAVDLSPLISHRFTLEELETAFRTQLDPEEAIKVLVRAAP